MIGAVILLGGGGHARVVLDALLRAGARVAGVVAPRVGAAWPRDRAPHLGDDAWLLARGPDGVLLANGVGGLAPLGRRARLFGDFKGAGFSFLTAVDPHAVICAATLGEGTFVAAGAIVQVGARIGANCLINSGAIIEHDCHIGDHVQVASGAVLAGGVRVGLGAFLGAGATILEGRVLGEGCQVAAGAVVVEDVLAHRTVAGVPARERGA